MTLRQRLGAWLARWLDARPEQQVPPCGGGRHTYGHGAARCQCGAKEAR